MRDLINKKWGSSNNFIKKSLMVVAGASMLSLAFGVDGAFAQTAAGTVDKGDTTWLLISTMVVLAMTIPGLPLFYGGLVRAKNMLSMMMQVGMTVMIGMIVWLLWGYSLTLTGGPLQSFIGGFSKVFLNGVTTASTSATYSKGVEIPEFVFLTFQMTFAAITPAVVYGATAERMKFSASVIFAILWPLLSYYPIAHMVWFGEGMIYKWGALDFAGGTVVHINAGMSALVACLILGARSDYKNAPTMPHSLVMNFIGAGLLWFGWLGFNGGSNLESNGLTSLVVFNTMIAAAAASFSWAMTEWIVNKKASLLGYTSGMIAGLVVITPACGVAGPVGSMVLGLIVSPICIYFVAKVKHIFKYDDTLDVFGIHGVGGILGALATGIVCSPALGGLPPANYSMPAQFIVQLKATLVSICWSSVATFIVMYVIKYTVGLKVTEDDEEEGLDMAEHGERAYHQ